MLLRLSPEISVQAKINSEVGKAFTLEERKKFKNTSFDNLKIAGASLEIQNLLVLDNLRSTCKIVMRSNGVLISFRSNFENFALVIPNHKLRFYKGTAEEYSFHKDNYFIKIKVGKLDKDIHQFIRRIRDFRLDTAPTRIEDLL